MIETKIDWARLEKALAVEIERNFINLKGKQYYFHEFFCTVFSERPPIKASEEDAKRWRSFAVSFASYPLLREDQRQHLVYSVRIFLQQLKSSPEKPQIPQFNPNFKLVDTSIPPTPRPQVKLSDRLQTIREIGAYRAKRLDKLLDLCTVKDALFYYPRDYVDYSRQVNIADLVAGETVTVVGKIASCDCFTSPKKKTLTIFNVVVKDATGKVKLTRFFAGRNFNTYAWQHKLKSQYPTGAIVAASGLVKQNKYGTTLDNPEIEVIDSPAATLRSNKIGQLSPIYPLTEGITAETIRIAVTSALPAIASIKDPMPQSILDSYSLIDLKEALENIHFPFSREMLLHARRRLVFDEFFYLQLGFLQRRQQEKQTQTSAVFAPTGELIEEFYKLLPFSLTGAQSRVVNEILGDLQVSSPMNRLIQGDVGSGKTVVAVFAILAAIQSGYQAAFMAPTEVLAEQHYRKLCSWFAQLNLPVALLTGSTKTVKRREIHAQLATGELPLLVGTHALIQDPVKFKQLGLVAIDEQHRFGVDQRAALLAKGNSPHILSMTATPIPRTLALTLHGDLDVSQIDELPPGRQPIETVAVNGNQRAKIYKLIKSEVEAGRQIYIIFPLIEESEKLDVKAAVEEHKRLSEVIFPEFEIGLLHGRLSSAEKEEALTDFRDNKTQIIVSTTVIEVGVDVPNATVMLIENAERFGLSQLHQLRGRVGRGSHKSYCFLMSKKAGDGGISRLSVLEQSTDGFFISEMDLRFRGPGEVLGKRQSGLPDFALASLVEDQEVLNIARVAAEELITTESDLSSFPELQQELDIRYQKLVGGEIMT